MQARNYDRIDDMLALATEHYEAALDAFEQRPGPSTEASLKNARRLLEQVQKWKREGELALVA